MPGSRWRPFVPKLVTVIGEGYHGADLRADALAGLTVAIIALPLAMALAIASGTTPDRGLLTAVIAGFLISALGGSRVQIGGPTGAFVVVVFNVIAQYGYDGLVLATLMAGLILVVAGLARLGTWIKYIPDPVVTGFTTGIALIIFSSQVRELFGLSMESVPAEFVEKWVAFWHARATVNHWSVVIALGSLALILWLRRTVPRFPSFLASVVAASAAVAAFGLDVDTIGSRFGAIGAALPSPSLPEISPSRVRELLPSALTIAFLAGVESLLSAVVADGMTSRRHRSNCELVAQGIANVASALFGGMPATGAIARTATNIRSGARSPVAGMLHAVFLLAFMLTLAPLTAYVPLASLAAVLVVVAWNMAEIGRFRRLLGAPAGDRAVLLVTFGLTVLVDLTVAIEVGVVLASVLFMHRMAEAVAVEGGPVLFADDEEEEDAAGVIARESLPAGVEVFEVRGPLFFGASGRLLDLLDATAHQPPAVFVLRMRAVPLVDASGESALREFVRRCAGMGTRVVLTELQPAARVLLQRMKFMGHHPGVTITDDMTGALRVAAPA
ncbi:MAG: SulP family inorganic anion transporter [Candidatus Binatia bacterium]